MEGLEDFISHTHEKSLRNKKPAAQDNSAVHPVPDSTVTPRHTFRLARPAHLKKRKVPIRIRVSSSTATMGSPTEEARKPTPELKFGEIGGRKDPLLGHKTTTKPPTGRPPEDPSEKH